MLCYKSQMSSLGLFSLFPKLTTNTQALALYHSMTEGIGPEKTKVSQ